VALASATVSSDDLRMCADAFTDLAGHEVMDAAWR